MRSARMAAVAVLGLLLALLAAGASSAGAATGVPYTDPDAVGTIGLCNQAGQQITSGSVSTTPFAWRAVSTVPAPSPYNNTGRTAVLVAYQPQQELPAGDWSGEQLTASSHYSNPTNPMAAATDGDESLGTFIRDYPPKWDGFIELRMYLGTDNEPSYQEKYPVLNVKVTGSTWHAVGGGAVNCSSGTAESIETMLLPPSTTTTAPKAATQPAAAGAAAGGSTGSSGSGSSGTSGNSSASGGGTGTSTGTGKGGGDGSPATSSARAAEATTSSSTPVGLIVGVVVAVVAVLAVAWLLFSRRRRTGKGGPTADPGPGGGAPEPAGAQGEQERPQADAGGGPAADHDRATSHVAATKGE